MIALWMAHCTVLAALLALAAWAAEGALRLHRLPGRWVWGGAIALSLLLPLLLWLLPARAAAPPSALAEVQVWLGPLSVAALPDAAVTSGRLPPAPEWLDGLLLALWLGASLLLAARLVSSLLTLHRARQQWEPALVDGVQVHLTPEQGPAVVGLIRGAIVLPRQVLQWEAARRRLILAHEQEHLRAGDPLLLLGGALALLLMPWNLALWWQTRRLRLATEVDCDARVLRRHPDARGYGTLLLEVGRLRSTTHLATAFSEPRSSLERRIRIMTRHRPRRYRLQAAGLAAAAVLLLALACQLDRPVGPQPDPTPAAVVPADPPLPPSDPTQDLSQAPTFTPYEQAPEILDRAELVRSMRSAFPPALRDAGIGGTARVWVFIDEDGVVQNTRLVESAGRSELDEAAEAVLRQVRFKPAINRGQAVPVWVQMPVTFQVPSGPDPAPPAEQPSSAAGPPARSTLAPDTLLLWTALERYYPSLLQAGPGQHRVVWFLTSSNGEVLQTGTEPVPASGNSSSSSIFSILRGKFPQIRTESMLMMLLGPQEKRTGTAVWIRLSPDSPIP